MPVPAARAGAPTDDWTANSRSGKPFRSVFCELGTTALLGLALLGCFWLSRRMPLAALLAALFVFLGQEAAAIVLDPGAILLSFVSATGAFKLAFRLVVLFLLLREVLAARKLQTFTG
jgi:hypothetical protein